MSKDFSSLNNIETRSEDAAARKSGRTSFDVDGRGIWEWQVATGVFTRTVTEDQLMELAHCNLQLLEDASAEAERGMCIYQLANASTARSFAPAARPKASATPPAPQGSVRRLLRRFVKVV
jgi:hypothetical protein